MRRSQSEGSGSAEPNDSSTVVCLFSAHKVLLVVFLLMVLVDYNACFQLLYMLL